MDKKLAYLLIVSCLLLLGNYPKSQDSSTPINGLFDIKDRIKGNPLFPGCSLPNCCFDGWGCPQPFSENFYIDIYTDHEFVKEVGLGLTDLSDSLKRYINAENRVKLNSNNETITAGKTLSIKSWDPTSYSVEFNGILPIFSFDHDAIIKKYSVLRKKLKSDSAALRQFEKMPPVVLTIVGRIGNVPVSKDYFKSDLLRFLGTPSLPTQDYLDLLNKQGHEASVAMIDGNRELRFDFPLAFSTTLTSTLIPNWCVNDEGYRGNHQIQIGNFLSNICETYDCGSTASLTNEVVVFSKENALYIDENVVFTDNPGDRIVVPLCPVIEIPVTVWVLYDSFFNWFPWGSFKDIKADIKLANTLFYDMGSGIRLSFRIRDRSNQSPKRLLDAGCNEFSNIQDMGWFDPDRLNVYYVRANNVMGEWCFGQKMIFINSNALAPTLAHEIGHALSLQHTNWSSLAQHGLYFTAKNLMWPQATEVNFITEGQSFRMNVDEGSWLNTGNDPVSSSDDIRCGIDRNCPILYGVTHNICNCPRSDLDL